MLESCWHRLKEAEDRGFDQPTFGRRPGRSGRPRLPRSAYLSTSAQEQLAIDRARRG